MLVAVTAFLIGFLFFQRGIIGFLFSKALGSNIPSLKKAFGSTQSCFDAIPNMNVFAQRLPSEFNHHIVQRVSGHDCHEIFSEGFFDEVRNTLVEELQN